MMERDPMKHREPMGHGMPTKHPEVERIHDFVDDELPADDRARVAAHLAECTDCRAVAGSARSLREEAKRVLAEPSAVPAPDQWSAIEARIRAGAVAAATETSTDATTLTGATALTGATSSVAQAARGGAMARWDRRALRAAAAVLLIVTSSAATVLWMRSGDREGVVAGASAEGGASGGVGGGPGDVALSGDDGLPATLIAFAYRPVFAELETLLADNRDRLQPETIATLEANIAILNTAILEIEEALAADPANRGTLKSLDGVYQAKLGLLKQAVALSRGA